VFVKLTLIHIFLCFRIDMHIEFSPHSISCLYYAISTSFIYFLSDWTLNRTDWRIWYQSVGISSILTSKAHKYEIRHEFSKQIHAFYNPWEEEEKQIRSMKLKGTSVGLHSYPKLWNIIVEPYFAQSKSN